MKTNITMQSPDRELFGITIRQETKTGFLNLSDLQEAYIRARVLNNWNDKRVDDIMSSKSNTERIYYILKERGLIITEFSAFISNIEEIGLTKYLKNVGFYRTTGARHTRTTWCDPYIWVLIAMELNPMLYARVVLWLGDKLILNRIEAGNFYKGLTNAISKFKNIDYSSLAKALNWKIFGRHETGIRNLATKEELKRLTDLESKIAFAIDMGYIKTFSECIETINKCNI